MIDIHTHVLPGIDDGAKTIIDSIEIIKKASLNGVTDMIVTPHFILGSDYTCNNVEKRKLINKLKRLVKKEEIDINLYLGNEVYIENNMLDLKKNGDICTLNNSRYILFELPLNDSYNGVEDILFDLGCNKKTGIIAHPERYASVKKDPNILIKWLEAGALLQCNIGSFFGHYGKHAEKIAYLLLKHKAISFISTDIHRPSSNYYEKISELKKIMKKYLTDEEIEEIFIDNAKKVINKEVIEPKKIGKFKKTIFGNWK